jgi:hypothetical protein
MPLSRLLSETVPPLPRFMVETDVSEDPVSLSASRLMTKLLDSFLFTEAGSIRIYGGPPLAAASDVTCWLELSASSLSSSLLISWITTGLRAGVDEWGMEVEEPQVRLPVGKSTSVMDAGSQLPASRPCAESSSRF